MIASGKTTWATKYIEENSTRNFDLLNIERVLSQMAVSDHMRVCVMITVMIVM